MPGTRLLALMLLTIAALVASWMLVGGAPDTDSGHERVSGGGSASRRPTSASDADPLTAETATAERAAATESAIPIGPFLRAGGVVLTARGERVAGATVRFTPFRVELEPREAVTDADDSGRFSTQPLPEGAYHLSVARGDVHDVVLRRVVELRAGMPPMNLELGQARIDVTLAPREVGEQRLCMVYVHRLEPDRRRQSHPEDGAWQTDVCGRFLREGESLAVGGLPAGRYRLSIDNETDDDGVQAPVFFDLAPAEVVRHRLRLEAPATLVARVPEKYRRHAYTLELERMDGDAEAAEELGGLAVVEFDGVPPASYRLALKVWNDEGGTLFTVVDWPVTLVAGQRFEFDVPAD